MFVCECSRLDLDMTAWRPVFFLFSEKRSCVNSKDYYFFLLERIVK